jgi:hypothetical protein
MEELAKKYRGKAEFLFVYCREAHPEGDPGSSTRTKDNQPIKQAMTVAQRKATAWLFCNDMKMNRRILVDEFDDQSAQRRYGGMQDPTIVIDVDGKIALKMAWTDGELADEFLEKFLAQGGKLNEALARAVPMRGGGGGMPADMLKRLLGDLNLSPADTKLVKSVLRSKMALRGVLDEKTRLMDDLARRSATPEAELAEAIADFEKALAEYQKAAAEQDRKLSAKVSARVKARLLAAGVLENGIGFRGPRMRPPEGAWNSQLHVATSRDGLHWRPVGGPILRHAGGPSLVQLSGKGKVGKKSSLSLYTAQAREGNDPVGRIVRLASPDDGKTWTKPEAVALDRLPADGHAIEPSVVQLEDGRLRIYFCVTGPGGQRPGRGETRRIFSAVSNDGLHFTLEDGPRLEAPDVGNPRVVRAGDGWLMFLPRGWDVTLARSEDGLHFRHDGKFQLQDASSPGVVTLKDGKVRLFLGERDLGSALYDPRTGRIEREEGVRIGGANESAGCELAGGGYIMVFKSPVRQTER